MQRSLLQIGLIILASAVIIALLGWWFQVQNAPQSLELEPETEFEMDGPLPADELERVNQESTNPSNPTAIMMTNQGAIAIELYEDVMPVTVGNFVSLAEDGFFNGTKFHRVIEGFMIQGGDPNSAGDDSSVYGQGGPGYTIQDEFVEDPRLTNLKGTIAMANTGQPNSGGSQFFINTADNTGLDFNKQPLSSKHPVFGRVIDGQSVVEAIERTETGSRDVPVEPVIIESVTIQRGS